MLSLFILYTYILNLYLIALPLLYLNLDPIYSFIFKYFFYYF